MQPVTVRKWAAKGKIPCDLTAGGHRRFALDEVRQAIGTPRGDASLVLSTLRREIDMAAVKPLHVSLFGSVARGTERPGSDVDLLVIEPAFGTEKERAAFDRLMVTMIFAIDRAVGRDLRIVRLSVARLERLVRSGSTLLVDVLNEGRTAWGQPLREVLMPIVAAMSAASSNSGS